MSNANPISLYPDNPAQRDQIVAQANKQDEQLSEYCLKATKQRLARELQNQNDDLDVTAPADLQINSDTLSVQFQALASEITDEIASATDVDTQPELVYTVALWELLAGQFSSEQRAAALAAAPEILDQRVTELRRHGGEDP